MCFTLEIEIANSFTIIIVANTRCTVYDRFLELVEQGFAAGCAGSTAPSLACVAGERVEA